MKFREVRLSLSPNNKVFIGNVDKTWKIDELGIEVIRVVRYRFVWLQIRKNFGRTVIKSWELMQDIKNHCLGEEVSAIEVFPAQSKLRNKSHCRHLFVVDGFNHPDLNEIYEELKNEL